MAYDATTADRIRRLLAGRDDVTEKRMIGGGLGFLVEGRLCCGLGPRGLSVRVGPHAKREVLSGAHVEPLVIGTRETAAFVVVEPAGYATDEALRAWIERGLRFVATLR